MSAMEEEFAFQLRAHKVGGWVREYQFHETRRWRYDFAWPALRIAVELEGGIFGKKSAHNTGAGIRRDMEKSNEAQRLGWRVFRFYVDDVKCGKAALYIIKVLKELPDASR